jgi:hypothetical protein
MGICCNILNITHNIQNINNVRTSVSLQREVHLDKLNKVLRRTKTQKQQRRRKQPDPFSVQDTVSA